MNRILQRIIFGLFIVVVAVVTLAAAGWGVIVFIHRPLHQPSFFAQLTVDLEGDGEAVHIARVLECKTFEKGGGRSLISVGERGATNFATTVGASGTHLKSGGAIMVRTPYRCANDLMADQGGKTIRRVRPNETGYLPLMAWMPDAEDPTSLEVYPAAAYFEKSSAWVKVKRVEVTDAPENSQVDPPDEFEWFTGKILKGEQRRESSRAAYSGFAAMVLAEGQWRGHYPVLDAELAGYDLPSLIKSGPAAAAVFRKDSAHPTSMTLIPAPCRQLEDNCRRPGDPTKDRLVRRMADDQFFALSQEGNNSVRVEKTPHEDYLILERNDTRARLTVIGAVIRREGSQMLPDPSHPSAYLYDPETKEIFWVLEARMTGKPRKSDPRFKP